MTRPVPVKRFVKFDVKGCQGMSRDVKGCQGMSRGVCLRSAWPAFRRPVARCLRPIVHVRRHVARHVRRHPSVIWALRKCHLASRGASRRRLRRNTLGRRPGPSRTSGAPRTAGRAARKPSIEVLTRRSQPSRRPQRSLTAASRGRHASVVWASHQALEPGRARGPRAARPATNRCWLERKRHAIE